MLILFLLAALLPRGAVGDACDDGSTWDGFIGCNVCGAGRYAGSGMSSCAYCAAGRFSGSHAGACTLCSPGKNAPGTGSGHCTLCAAGKYENRDGSQGCMDCAIGKYSGEGNTFCTNCASGKFWSSTGAYTCLACFPGKFATADSPTEFCDECALGKYEYRMGSQGCIDCAAGSYSKKLGRTQCRLCDAGTYSGPGSSDCDKCRPGYSSADGAASCTACTAGKYTYFWGTPQCLACPAGKTSFNGATSCTSCTAGRFASSGDSFCTSCGDGAGSHWDSFAIGAESQSDCVCAAGYTGKLCDIEGCRPVLRGASLGGLLLEAAWPEPTRDLNNAEMTWNTILRSADVNGDNYLSNDEALKAIASMHFSVPTAVTRLWSRQVEGTFTFEEFDEFKVTISAMIEDTIRSRLTVDFYQHGGASGNALQSMAATYPAADWTEGNCTDKMDGNANGGVDWTWELDTSEKTLYRQCIYRNGFLVDNDAFSKDLADGSACKGTPKKCEVRDTDRIGGSEDDNRKRLYCVEALFCPRGVACDAGAVVPSLIEVRCSTGLVYDGSPADVVPALISSTGVRFAWLDTSLFEQGFRIFRSPVDAKEKTTLIADIPTTSKHCGQPFSPISYYDRDVGDVPGTHVMYTVSTVDEEGDPKQSTTALFTSPWVGMLTVSVTSESGSPVRGVSVSVDHLLEDGSADDKYSPLILGVTDNYGEFESEIRVTDRSWTAVKQHFLIQVSKSTQIGKGEFQHVFAPPSMHTTVQHFQSATVDFVDESTVSISGVVRYDLGTDPTDFGGAGDCAYSTEASGCYCPVPKSVVIVDRGRGDIESFPTNEMGAFEFSAAYNSNLTVRLKTFNGPDGVGRDHTFRLEAVSGDGESDPSRSSPSTTFVATRDTILEFVATDEVKVRVGVLGGGEGVAYVIGQPVVFGLAGCTGFQRKLFTYMGYVSTVLPPAPAYQLRLGAADKACSSMSPDKVFEFGADKADGGCRAEMPVFPDFDNATRPCASSKFTYVDEFFTEVGSARVVDLSALDVNATKDAVHDELYYFAAPLCVDKVELESAQLQDLNKWASSAGAKRSPPLAKSESMLLQPPQPEEDGPEPYGSTCFGKNSLGGVFVEGDTFWLKFDLVERHPKPLAALLWPWSFEIENGVVVGLKVGGKGPVHDFVESKPLAGAAISVLVNDGISGVEPEPATYNLDVAEFGYAHSVLVGDPNPFTPFTKVVFFVFEREIDGAKIDFTRHAIVLGVIQDAVPTIFMMATDPTLIFTVLRDPPGGDSFAMITEGTEMSMSMGISGMHAAGHAYEATNGGSGGLSVRLGVSLGLGVEAAKGILDLRGGVGFEHSLTGPAVGASRARSQAHDLTFTFDLAVSTSTDPFLAGQPSDVIVGGGANLRVLTAIKVDIQNQNNEQYCVSGKRTYEWLPEQVSTFVATVYEIERTMGRLVQLIGEYETDDTSAEVVKSRNALKNWQTVLRDYRAATLASETTLAGGISATLEGYKKKFALFASASEDSDTAFSAYLAEGLSELSESDHVSRFSIVLPGQNSIDKEEVSDYAASVSKFIAASEANCKVGDMFGLGTLCATPQALTDSREAAHKLLGVCAFATDVERPAAVASFCQDRVFAEVNDATGETEAARSAFDAFSNVGRLITFSGTAAVEFEYSVGEAAVRSTDVGFQSDAATSYGVSESLCANILRARRLWDKPTFEGTLGDGAEGQENAPTFCRRLAEADEAEGRRLGIGVNADFSQNWGSSFSVELSRSSSRTDAQTHAVSVTLADPSPYDFFAVKVTQDPVHGTPIFETMGGQSSCPGETGTTKIDSRVTIESLEYHCGDSFKPRADCNNLAIGEVATIGVILQNISPSLRPVLYRLDVQQTSPWNAGKYYGGEAGYCGQAGDRSGLKISINGEFSSQYKLDGLPYGQTEVFLTVEKTHPSCFEFSDISITLTSQCEYDADDVYQYRTALSEDVDKKVSVIHPVIDTVNGGWALDADDEPTKAYGPDSSTKAFSVTWQRYKPMSTPEPTTRFPTHAPTASSLAVSVAVVARVGAGATQSSYCADLESSGVVEVQAAVVAGYVVEQFGFNATQATALCADGARAGDVAVVVSLTLYAADVVDRAAGRSAKTFADELSASIAQKIVSGAWAEDQRAAIKRAAASQGGRRLAVDAVWASEIVEAATFSNETQVQDVQTLTPSAEPTYSKSPVLPPTPGPSTSPRPTSAPSPSRTFAALPDDSDDGDDGAESPLLVILVVLVSIVLVVLVVLVILAVALLFPQAPVRLKAGMRSFRRKRREDFDLDPKIQITQPESQSEEPHDAETPDRADMPPSPLHR